MLSDYCKRNSTDSHSNAMFVDVVETIMIMKSYTNQS